MSTNISAAATIYAQHFAQLADGRRASFGLNLRHAWALSKRRWCENKLCGIFKIVSLRFGYALSLTRSLAFCLRENRHRKIL
jgi:hypothetical protein